VLGAAREAGRAVVCSSNLRQIGLANLAYSVDHHGYYVPGAANFAANLNRWHGQRDHTSEAFDPTRGPLWDYYEIDDIKQCPDFVPDQDYVPGFETSNGGYGYNLSYVGADDVSDVFTELAAKAGWFAQPSETVMFTDAAIAHSGPMLIEYSFCEPYLNSFGVATPSIHFRHDGANVLWLDGHGDRRTLDRSANSVYGATEAQCREMRLGWFGPDNNTLFDRD